MVKKEQLNDKEQNIWFMGKMLSISGKNSAFLCNFYGTSIIYPRAKELEIVIQSYNFGCWMGDSYGGLNPFFLMPLHPIKLHSKFWLYVPKMERTGKARRAIWANKIAMTTPGIKSVKKAMLNPALAKPCLFNTIFISSNSTSKYF